ncbi:cytochrome c oxidase assembly protein subunit 15 [Microcella alkaliphila]|uniref:Cytochrome c oxidase assembly protein subunit 15 n=1 Tax=Microcella alkaliphila TaxID=279828 RepID=A0A4Q7TSY7_9MICO|nr:COX15/CtaA family protein [Microcella alkaliphila]RZT64121.1 cytochrome c oxidase assembly protein subunit 15 [Microcella alkaliphila]
MSQQVAQRPSIVRRFVGWLPTEVTRRVRVFAWLSLISQTLIVGTGGAVRLTGSGLGCPTWPRCTEESFIATPEMGIHGAVEFGNRLLTFVLIIIAIVAFLFVVRMRRERPELLRLTVALGLGIPIQAVIGGITVLTNLNPYVVGLHFVVSAVLVALATVFVARVYRGKKVDRFVVNARFRAIAMVTAVGVWITVLVGILVTGSGPHAGDEGAARNGLDSELLQHIHSWPAYITGVLSLALMVWALRTGRSGLQKATIALVAVEALQIVIGIAQARLGLPIILVGVHMVLACVLVAVMTLVLVLQRPGGRELEGQQRVDADGDEDERQVRDARVEHLHR